MLDHLDDPDPRPAPPTAQVVARGRALRRRRRAAALGGTAATTTLALLAVLTLTGGSGADSLRVTPDPVAPASEAPTAGALPTPTATPSPTASPTPSPTPSPSPVMTGSTLPPWAPDVLLPARTAQPPIADCTAAQEAQTHPAAATPPPGVEVLASEWAGGVGSIPAGGFFSLNVTVRNTGTAPVTFDYLGEASGIYLHGRYVAGQFDPKPATNVQPGPRTVQPGQSVVVQTELSVSSRTCAGGTPKHLPYGRYDVSAGLRTDQGTWYAPSFPGWLLRYAGCTPDQLPPATAPAAGLTLALVDVPARVPFPDSSFTARLRVTNTSSRTQEFVDEDPGRRVAYLAAGDGTVSGGWSSGAALPPRTYALAPGESRDFDLAVRGEGCSVDEPIGAGAYRVHAGIATVKDGQPYLWTVLGGQVSYPQ